MMVKFYHDKEQPKAYKKELYDILLGGIKLKRFNSLINKAIL